MQPFHMARETRAALYISTLRVLRGAEGVTDDHSEAFAAAICSEYPDECFGLARALDGYLYPFTSAGEFCNVDISELRPEHDDSTIRAGLTLAGLRERQDGRWTNAPAGRGGQHARTLRLPAHFLRTIEHG